MGEVKEPLTIPCAFSQAVTAPASKNPVAYTGKRMKPKRGEPLRRFFQKSLHLTLPCWLGRVLEKEGRVLQ